MEWNFDQEVKRIQKKEVESFLAEQSQKSEWYYQQASKDGYDNLHDYERDVTIGLTKRLIAVSIIIVCLIIIGMNV